jgi:hypothetical protein
LIGYLYRTRPRRNVTKDGKSGKSDGNHSKPSATGEGEQTFMPASSPFSLRFAIFSNDGNTKLFPAHTLQTVAGRMPMNPTTLRNTLLTTLFPSYRARLIEQAGGEVARECQTSLWKRVRQQTYGMSAPEIRGYARAHAAEFAANHVDLVLDRRSLQPSLRLSVLASSIDQLVSMTIRDALSDEMPAVARPMAA